MAQFEVEFVEPDLPPDRRSSAVAALRPSAGGLSPLAWAAVALLIVAAALCLIAPSQTMFTFRFDGPVLTSHGGLDGWGRQLASTPGGGRTTQHGPRFGIVLVVCAGLLGVLAAAIARGERTDADPQSRSDRWLRAVPPAGLIGIGGALTGVVAAIALTIESQYATYQDVYIALSSNGAGSLRLSTGSFIWLTLAAVVCTGSAVVLVVLLRRRERARPAGPVVAQRQGREQLGNAAAQAANRSCDVPVAQDGEMMGSE